MVPISQKHYLSVIFFKKNYFCNTLLEVGNLEMKFFGWMNIKVISIPTEIGQWTPWRLCPRKQCIRQNRCYFTARWLDNPWKVRTGGVCKKQVRCCATEYAVCLSSKGVSWEYKITAFRSIWDYSHPLLDRCEQCHTASSPAPPLPRPTLLAADTLLAYFTQSSHIPAEVYSSLLVLSEQSTGVVDSLVSGHINDSSSMSHV